MKGRRLSWILVGSLILFALSLVNAASVGVGGDGRQDNEGVGNVPQNDVKVGEDAPSGGSNTAADSGDDSKETAYVDSSPEETDGEVTDGRRRRAAVSAINVSQEAKSVVGRTFDLSYLTKFTNNVQLTFAGKPVNLAAFKINTVDTERLDKFLGDQSLADRLYIVSKLAGIEKKLAAKENKILTTFAIEDLDDPDDDIVLDRQDVDDLEKEIEEDPSLLNLNGPTPAVHRVKRKVAANPSSQWPTTVPYIITSDFDSYASDKQAILDGIRHWEDETCLDFVRVGSSTLHHLVFKRQSGCRSYVGKKKFLAQNISIGGGCGTRGIVAHEIGHALGFWHEQSRPDRNAYVNIHSANIKSDKHKNFIRRSWKEALALGVPYDYSSIMHYPTNSFSENGYKTITSKEPVMDRTLGSRYGLSFFDVKLANYRYCNDKCIGGLTWSACRNDGYRDPKNCNKCKCPDGWSGTLCTVVKPGVNANCGSNDLTATTSWTTFSSPYYYTYGYPANSECTWRIKAPGSNTRVVMQFTDTFSFHCSSTCWNYIEVRNQDLARTGPRYCCTKPTKYFRSHGNEMLLLMRITSGGRMKGFKLRYKIEPCGGCRTQTSTFGVACEDTQAYSCRGLYNVTCGSGVCARYRSNTCYKLVKTCCNGFRLLGNTCHKEWSHWSVWSTCSRTCEDYGTRTRSRLCLIAPCNRPTTQTETCNRWSCPKTCTQRYRCGGSRYRNNYCIKYVKCPPPKHIKDVERPFE